MFFIFVSTQPLLRAAALVLWRRGNPQLGEDAMRATLAGERSLLRT